jgi:serine/threonine protein kinase
VLASTQLLLLIKKKKKSTQLLSNLGELSVTVFAVILFLGACTKPPRLSMVTEYMEMGSLYYLIHLSGQKKKLSWRRRLKMLRDICRSHSIHDLEIFSLFLCLHYQRVVCCNLVIWDIDTFTTAIL